MEDFKDNIMKKVIVGQANDLVEDTMNKVMGKGDQEEGGGGAMDKVMSVVGGLAGGEGGGGAMDKVMSMVGGLAGGEEDKKEDGGFNFGKAIGGFFS